MARSNLTSAYRLVALIVLLAVVPAFSHMQMSNPPPRRSSFAPLANYLTIDYSMTEPLFADGSNYPCKRYPATDVTRTMTAGTSFPVSIVGSATHGGGHCQFALSYDGGATFVVLSTVLRTCLSSGSAPFTFNVPVPAGAPACASCVFAWTWINAIGNREYYMNCADVRIVGAAAPPPALGFTAPLLFVANLPSRVRIGEFAAGSDGAGYFAQRCNVAVSVTAAGSVRTTVSTANACGQFNGPDVAPSPTTDVPITAAPTTARATQSPTIAPTTVVPTLPRVDTCTLADPSFVCTTGCALYQCDPNQGVRIRIPCPQGTACVDGACGFGSCVDGATVPLFFARADGGGDSATAKKGVSNTRPIDSTLATWYWAACIGLVLSLVVAVAAAAKRYSSEAKVVTTPIFAAACVVAGEGDSI